MTAPTPETPPTLPPELQAFFDEKNAGYAAIADDVVKKIEAAKGARTDEPPTADDVAARTATTAESASRPRRPRNGTSPSESGRENRRGHANTQGSSHETAEQFEAQFPERLGRAYRLMNEWLGMCAMLPPEFKEAVRKRLRITTLPTIENWKSGLERETEMHHWQGDASLEAKHFLVSERLPKLESLVQVAREVMQEAEGGRAASERRVPFAERLVEIKKLTAEWNSLVVQPQVSARRKEFEQLILKRVSDFNKVPNVAKFLEWLAESEKKHQWRGEESRLDKQKAGKWLSGFEKIMPVARLVAAEMGQRSAGAPAVLRPDTRPTGAPLAQVEQAVFESALAEVKTLLDRWEELGVLYRFGELKQKMKEMHEGYRYPEIDEHRGWIKGKVTVDDWDADERRDMVQHALPEFRTLIQYAEEAAKVLQPRQSTRSTSASTPEPLIGAASAETAAERARVVTVLDQWRTRHDNFVASLGGIDSKERFDAFELAMKDHPRDPRKDFDAEAVRTYLAGQHISNGVSVRQCIERAQELKGIEKQVYLAKRAEFYPEETSAPRAVARTVDRKKLVEIQPVDIQVGAVFTRTSEKPEEIVSIRVTKLKDNGGVAAMLVQGGGKSVRGNYGSIALLLNELNTGKFSLVQTQRPDIAAAAAGAGADRGAGATTDTPVGAAAAGGVGADQGTTAAAGPKPDQGPRPAKQGGSVPSQDVAPQGERLVKYVGALRKQLKELGRVDEEIGYHDRQGNLYVVRALDSNNQTQNRKFELWYPDAKKAIIHENNLISELVAIGVILEGNKPQKQGGEILDPLYDPNLRTLTPDEVRAKVEAADGVVMRKRRETLAWLEREVGENIRKYITALDAKLAANGFTNRGERMPHIAGHMAMAVDAFIERLKQRSGKEITLSEAEREAMIKESIKLVIVSP